MNRDQKAAAIAEIAADIESSQAVFAVDYRGIAVPAAELRAKLREADAVFRVVKNSLTERAATQTGAEDLKPLLQGPTALTFVRAMRRWPPRRSPTTRASRSCSPSRAA